MSIRVKSEIAPLKRVLLHRPGQELEHLIPSSLERLLFDDIPYLYGAIEEHDCFAKILEEQGAEVVYLEDLTAETIAQSKELRQQFIGDAIAQGGSTATSYAQPLQEFFSAITNPKELVLKTMSGVSLRELELGQKDSLTALLQDANRFAMDPIPNLYFTRDPFACIGNGVSLNRMYSTTRNRETLYGKYILEHHPDYAGKVPFYYQPSLPFSIEGGDILNLTAETVMVGISQRTSPEAVELLAKALFSHPESQIQRVLAAEIPKLRAYMHLDTVFTQVDRDKFAIHHGILETLRLFSLTPKGDGEVVAKEHTQSPEKVLAEVLGVDQVTFIPCGGNNSIAAEREQWNDGSNTLCIAPGKVIVYDRNYITNALFAKAGIETLQIPSGELSRGRGGPRCMSMPLLRE